MRLWSPFGGFAEILEHFSTGLPVRKSLMSAYLILMAMPVDPMSNPSAAAAMPVGRNTTCRLPKNVELSKCIRPRDNIDMYDIRLESSKLTCRLVSALCDLVARIFDANESETKRRYCKSSFATQSRVDKCPCLTKLLQWVSKGGLTTQRPVPAGALDSGSAEPIHQADRCGEVYARANDR